MTEIRQINDEQGNSIYPQTHAQAVVGLNAAITDGQAVKSVNSKTGIVQLTAADIGAATPGDIPDVPVNSVSGKTGDVLLNKSDVGLDQVNNTADMDKPISYIQQIALDDKVDKVEGKGLSTNDYTDYDKEKVEQIDDKQDRILVSQNGSKFILIVGDDGTLSTEAYEEGSGS
ncbi:hypothetical protein [Sporolactobacillus terrae]|uniref:hypothetical protein n=1 Tax=Sporolactobacillus terrae TaxID=269673 RepID=UPI001CBD059E|nr:hypothetical protein [Sporolactobacillus terrae]UAK17549.1 hypothetical protein K7399_06380 [Sporolactobacillus terrae]